MANLQVRRSEVNTYDHWVLDRKHYYDFFISRRPHYGDIDMSRDCVAVTIDPNEPECIGEDGETLYGSTIWKDAVNTGIELPDWGFCSVDNGYTKIDWDVDDLIDIFTNTTLTIPENDLRFFMKPVEGFYYCDPKIDYSTSIEEENNQKFIKADGGFYQGFYKLFLPEYTEQKYQTMYNRAEQVESYEFIIRPRNITKDNTLNFYFPENSGFFFYKGTRAENKWWYYSNKINMENFENLKKTILENGWCNYDELIDLDELRKAKSIYENLYTSSGVILNTPNFTEFETDNKYLFFNRTCCGYMVKDEDKPESILVGYQEKNKDLNYYLLFNRSIDWDTGKPLGLMVKDLEPTIGCCTFSYWSYFSKLYRCDPYKRYNFIDKPLQKLPEEFKDIDIYDNQYHQIYSDTFNNAMGFRITHKGELGYRINIQNCDEDKDENPTKLLEEYSSENVINWDQWNHIVVKIVYDIPINNPECSIEPSRTGTISFYVNGFLKFISKNYKEPIFKELGEYYEKQEGVPFNMSLMGGSQGLLETILSDNPQDYDRYILPIERFFTGTLMGDLRYFRMGECNIGLNQIRKMYIDFRKVIPLPPPLFANQRII
jgi:hypothetical protein